MWCVFRDTGMEPKQKFIELNCQNKKREKKKNIDIEF